MVRFRLRYVLVLGWILISAGDPATAQTRTDDLVGATDGEANWAAPEMGSAPDEPSFLESPITTAGRPLSLGEAVALSIRNNLDVEVERFAPMIAEADQDGAWGAYDPTINADFGYDVTKAPVTFLSGLNQAGTNRDSVLGGGVGLTQLVPYIGASLDLRFESNESRSRALFNDLNPQYNSTFFATATVPLLRDLFWNEPWTRVKTSAVQAESSLQGFRTVLMDNVRTTVSAYWNLVASRDQVRVAEKSLETARALLGQTRTQFEVGVVSRVEVVEAEAGVANREFEMIRTSNEFQNAQDTLIDIVLGRELSALTDLQFTPTEDPEAYEPRRVDVTQAVAQAFQNRSEINAADRAIEQGELELKFAKSQRLPQLDLEGRFGYVGVSGDARDPLNPSAFDGPYEDATDDFFDNRGADNYSARARFSIPFPNTTARKRVVRNELDLRRSRTRRARLEQSIVLEVRAAARLLQASSQGIAAAERRRLAAEEQLRAERIRLEHGESTPFEVLQRESDLVEAESQKINALQAYREAEIGLDRAQGTILEKYDIGLDDVREPMR